jgi:hypothetical protein
VFLSTSDNPRRTSQIVVYGKVEEGERILWHLVRTEAAPAEKRETASVPELPL